MSILDKPLAPQPPRSHRRLFVFLSVLVILLILLFACSDIRSDLAFVEHFVAPPATSPIMGIPMPCMP